MVIAFLAGGYGARNDTAWGAVKDASGDATAISKTIVATAAELAGPVAEDARALASEGGTHGAMRRLGVVLDQCSQGNAACRQATHQQLPGVYSVATKWSDGVMAGYAELTGALRQRHAGS